jgi:hypothetical protein
MSKPNPKITPFSCPPRVSNLAEGSNKEFPDARWKSIAKFPFLIYPYLGEKTEVLRPFPPRLVNTGWVAFCGSHCEPDRAASAQNLDYDSAQVQSHTLIRQGKPSIGSLRVKQRSDHFFGGKIVTIRP